MNLPTYSNELTVHKKNLQYARFNLQYNSLLKNRPFEGWSAFLKGFHDLKKNLAHFLEKEK